MEGPMIFCQKNILEYSLNFFGGKMICYKLRGLLTKGVSQIL